MESGALVGGKYRLVRAVGKGGMGTVWSATDTSSNTPVAIKLLSAEAAASAELRERLIREAGAAGRIRHPNVVDYRQIGLSESGEPFLVMELLEGQTVRQFIRSKGRVDVPTALWIASEVARALCSAHAAGIAHRDLKPSNVFLHVEPNGNVVVKVLDFGVSKFLTEELATMTSTGAAIGSPAYMSPEQAKGDRVDHRTDVWSMGVLIFEMLAGRRPFHAQSSVALLSAILFGRVPRLREFVSGVDPVVDAIVARCLERRVEARYQTAEQLLEALEARRAAFAEAANVDVRPSTPDADEPVPEAADPSEKGQSASSSQSQSQGPASVQSSSTAHGVAASLPSPPLPPAPQPARRLPVVAFVIPGVAFVGLFVALLALLVHSHQRANTAGAAPTPAPPSATPVAPATQPPTQPIVPIVPIVPIEPSASAKAEVKPSAAPTAKKPAATKPVWKPPKPPVVEPKKPCKSPIVDDSGKVVGCLD